jgi:hypothetical protein
MPSTSRPRRWWRRPVLHFAAGGAALLALHAWWRPADAPGAAPAPIVIGAAELRQIDAEFTDRWGAPPSDAQRRALINQRVEEELLYREARALALDYGDRSVRRRLLDKARALNLHGANGASSLQAALDLGLDDDAVIRRLLAEKMRLLLQYDDPGGAPSDAQIAAYLQAHADRFQQPERLTCTQLFFSTQTRGTRARADALAARQQLGHTPPSPQALQLADPFPIGAQLSAYTPTQLAGRFGKPFADQVLALAPGQWSEPIASPYGVHLVWVDAHAPAHLPPLDSVRDAIALALKKEAAAQNLARGLARLRSLYEIRIEPDPASAASG